jgi:hypothetical protein
MRIIQYFGPDWALGAISIINCEVAYIVSVYLMAQEAGSTGA